MAKQKIRSSARVFRSVRKHHSREIAEDYTELILELIGVEGEARTCRIAELMGVSHVTAVQALRRLQEQGLVSTAPRKPVVLTSKGKALAKYSKERHEVLLSFFQLIGVPLEIAATDVEGAEHHISPTSLKCIKLLTKSLEKKVDKSVEIF